MLTRVLAQELVHRGITVNAVSLDLDGPCEPGKIAKLVGYLLSEAGHRLTGRVIRLDDEGWDRGGDMSRR